MGIAQDVSELLDAVASRGLRCSRIKVGDVELDLVKARSEEAEEADRPAPQPKRPDAAAMLAAARRAVELENEAWLGHRNPGEDS